MPQPRPEYAIKIALFGLLVAIGVPALRRGEWMIGGPCLVLAMAVAIWTLVGFFRSRP
jgi:hypothetical protein